MNELVFLLSPSQALKLSQSVLGSLFVAKKAGLNDDVEFYTSFLKETCKLLGADEKAVLRKTEFMLNKMILADFKDLLDIFLD